MPIAAAPGGESAPGRRRWEWGVTVRVAGRVTEFGVDPVEHHVADRVFEDLGLVMHLVPAVAEFLHEEGFQQSVPADHRQRCEPAPPLGQRHRAVLLVVHQALVGQSADRLRGGAGRHSDAFGQQLGADLFFVRPLLGRPDRLEVVLGDRRQVVYPPGGLGLSSGLTSKSLGNHHLIWGGSSVSGRGGGAP